MSKKIISLTLVAFLTPVFQNATAATGRSPRANDRVITLELSDLRSAYLIRAGIVQYDEDSNSADDIRDQLQRHFDIVLGLLFVSTQRSIETALARLEAMDVRPWSGAERRAWRQQLLATRYLQLQRLASYRDRGQFPLNEGQAAYPVPIFVDRHNTACAVGHLMRLSGWSDSVALIQSTNNLVYVPDALRSAVTRWVITSGLTWEEAALIQPGYTFPAQHNAGEYAVGGQKLEKDGLRFENFQRVVVNYGGPACSILPQACQPVGDPSTGVNRMGIAAGKGAYTPQGLWLYPQHTPAGTHFILIGGDRPDLTFPYDDSLHTLHASARQLEGLELQRTVIRFDVSTVDPNARINGLSHRTYQYQGGFYRPFSPNPFPPFGEQLDGTYYLRTSASDGATSVASLLIDQDTALTGYYEKFASESFSPVQKLTIESEIWLQDGVGLETYLIDFNVINLPEPAGSMMVVLSFVAVGSIPRLRRRVC